MNIELLVITLLLAICVLIHELGHIIPFVLIKKKIPKIEVKFIQGIMVHITGLNIRDSLISLSTGIILGLIPLLFMITHKEFFFALFLYTLICSHDLFLTWLLIDLGKADGFDKIYKDLEIRGIE